MSADLSQCSDQDLAAFARAHREDAYRELLRRYKTGVYRLIVKQIGDADEAMDLTQETFVSGFSALDRYDGERPFRTWIARIALNKCRDWSRRRAVRSFFWLAKPIETDDILESDAPGPAREAESRAELKLVQKAMLDIPISLREVLTLRTIEELSQAETAAILGVSEKTVETRLYRARARLKKVLDETEA